MIPVAWYDRLPPLVMALALVAGFAALAELGFVAWRRLNRDPVHGGAADAETGDETQLLSAALLLLALLLGFTFSIALARYEDRRNQVVQEANDIGTAWLRAGLVATPAGKALQADLAAYARGRIRRVDGVEHPDVYVAARARAGALRQRVWQDARLAAAPLGTSAQGAALIAAVNAVLDRGTARDAAIEARVPERVLTLLIVYSGVAALLLGYVMAAFDRRHRVASTLLFVLLATTIGLILDVDRPLVGGVRVSQQPLIDLVADIGG
ncbi:hypothetical protein IP88_06970 [alpha proteobacterium AAP81b]|nr:hypothetical protein IP88_06970 [alpha proteobacterium AAP81b]